MSWLITQGRSVSIHPLRERKIYLEGKNSALIESCAGERHNQAFNEVLERQPALAPGARVRYHGDFMGKTVTWLTTVDAVHFPHVLALTITEGPFVGSSRIGIQRAGDGSRVQVHTTGDIRGMSFIPDAMIAGPMKAAMEGDLGRLKALIEA